MSLAFAWCPPSRFVLHKRCKPEVINLLKHDFNFNGGNLALCVTGSRTRCSQGEHSLQHKTSDRAAAAVLAKQRKNKARKKPGVVPSNVACCYGCGAPLHTGEEDAPGYIALDTYELKKKHHQLRITICNRCKLLSHGHMITAVGGHGGSHGGKQFISAEELYEKLSFLQHEKALIIKLVDIVDFNGSFLRRVRNLVGANPIILVVTKVDLLPKGTDMNCIGDWVVEAVTKKKLNVLSVHLTSAKSFVGIAGVVSMIKKEKKGRDVYILGSANVGKSAFINAILTIMAKSDPVAAAATRYKPMQSAVPGTTLGSIEIPAFHGGTKVFDTPGVHLHHRFLAVIHSDDLPLIIPKSCIKGQTVDISNNIGNGVQDHGFAGISVFWGGLVRVDVLKIHPRAFLTFYGPSQLQVHSLSIADADELYQEEVGATFFPPRKETSMHWTGLHGVRDLHIEYSDDSRPVCDIAVSGLGWIAIEWRDCLTAPLNSLEETSGELHLRVHVPKQVEIFVRSSMPVGKKGEEWYKYRELTDREEVSRPTWYT